MMPPTIVSPHFFCQSNNFYAFHFIPNSTLLLSDDLSIFLLSGSVVSCNLLIDSSRLHKSRYQDFYILDTYFLFNIYPVISMIGSTGNLYHINVYPKTFTCNCANFTSNNPKVLLNPFIKPSLPIHPCKHIILLLSLLGIDTSTRRITIDVNQFRNLIYKHRPFPSHRLRGRINQTCLNLLYLPSHGTVFSDVPADRCMCDKCWIILPKTSPSKTTCPLCLCDWKPYRVSIIGNHLNFYNVLTRFGYQLLRPRTNSKKRKRNTK